MITLTKLQKIRPIRELNESMIWLFPKVSQRGSQPDLVIALSVRLYLS